MQDEKQTQPEPEAMTITLDRSDMLKVAALCLAVSVLGSLCAIWLAKALK